ncbi:helix-turn-helix transcriptional regulator [Nocardia caishijiensis]|uniref:Helix-turn-helix protein n=1 Tax=Nocardia caishijiensis TaxID=184756 RepID=A0ABQ6YF01_9NOCA|nr:helix-turn-helix transcriptional regulator [Nocardia caishijiensis]KAF0835673.1 helix-turn-helix protein [Nocardia caishijiensis]
MTTTGDVIRRRRKQLGLSQAALARLVGVDQRTIGRYESGDTVPDIIVGTKLADALGVSVHELAGQASRTLDLAGDWTASWQTWGDTGERVDTHGLSVTQDGSFLALDGARARPVEDGSYTWTGELRLFDNESLIGWYVATEGAVRSKGSMYFALHPQGLAMAGSWVGQSAAGLVIRGWGAITRRAELSEPLVDLLRSTQGNLHAWPNSL